MSDTENNDEQLHQQSWDHSFNGTGYTEKLVSENDAVVNNTAKVREQRDITKIQAKSIINNVRNTAKLESLTKLLFSDSSIISLQNLATQLNGLTNNEIQTQIVADNYNIFAKVKTGIIAEQLPGLAALDGTHTFADNAFSFVYDNAAPNQLGDGLNLSTDSILKKYMCMAIYSNSTDATNRAFEGILVWSFDGTRMNNNSMNITNIASLFYNTGFGESYTPSEFWRVKPYFIKPDGIIITASDSGWRFSNYQQPAFNGYYNNSKFSYDDGSWGIEFGANIDGNYPGPNFSGGDNSYGIINYNSSDSNGSSSKCYIAGELKPDFKAYVFYK